MKWLDKFAIPSQAHSHHIPINNSFYDRYFYPTVNNPRNTTAQSSADGSEMTEDEDCTMEIPDDQTNDDDAITDNPVSTRTRAATQNRSSHDTLDVALMGILTVKEPHTFQQAWNHTNETERELWRIAIKKELGCMIERNLWGKVKDTGHIRTIGLKCVFHIKSDGRHRARLVALGYRQIAGIDYHDVHAPFLSPTCLRILLVLKMVLKLTAMKIDVEAAFLDGRLQEEIYVDLPEGLEMMDDETDGYIG